MLSPFEYSTTADLEEQECGSCGKEADTIYSCYWDRRLKVCEECLIHSDEAAEYSEPLCSAVNEIATSAQTVEDFVTRLKAHIAQCAACLGIRKTAQTDIWRIASRKEAA